MALVAGEEPLSSRSERAAPQGELDTVAEVSSEDRGGNLALEGTLDMGVGHGQVEFETPGVLRVGDLLDLCARPAQT
jgi:hypothetical protein